MKFYKGDTFSFKFQRKANGEVIKDLPNKLFFTVKNSLYDGRMVIQKTLTNGITKDDDNYYHVTIQPEDTNNLTYQTYFYDIEVITDTYKKTLTSGELTFIPEITLPENEV